MPMDTPGNTTTERLRLDGTDLVLRLTPRPSRLGLLALHGDVEGGTAELAEEVAARTGATCLIFTQPLAPPVHISSHLLAEAPSRTLATFVSAVSLTVSLHGHLRPATPASIFLGGTNRAAAETLAEALRTLTPSFTPVTDLSEIPPGLRGLHPRNPVNLTPEGGVQVELPLTARTQGLRDVPPEEVVAGVTEGVRRLALSRN
ncbi:poly-gamma-glutamate hydrolase family protein [Streptomyces sp. LaPpAH-108]|uniref:poly-gamma-glutamate hydrolase family protein n=1 Tax=Streptomyces sp. LaPpAH-108 TaxID=1155714 RepID=UPI00035FC35E|nr:poly-gamma-glutamate hydrolase family protein [Streptomyces sp. LaPpAH-108]